MWRVFSASATGQRNADQGTAGQDASHCLISEEQVLVAVVCDGAGSAREGRSGAQFMVRALAEQLSGTLNSNPGLLELDGPGGGGPLAQCVKDTIGSVRDRLTELAASSGLAPQDYSCTLVGCVAAPGGGCLFHIGDGFAIVQGADGESVLSRPENGEYADETYFVSDENWIDHLRLTPLAAPARGSIIGLLSDGTAPFAVDRARSGFFRPFIDPIAAFLVDATAQDGDEALRNLLESPRASAISSDDKTLLLAFVR